MKRNQIALSLISLMLLLLVGWQQKSATATNLKTVAKLAAKASKVLESSSVQPESNLKSKQPLPQISFENTVCDLGDVGQGTKNTCEFRFTNTGRGLLKIGKISRTCGCTVFHLDKKEYTTNETGTIKVIYTAGKSTGSTQQKKC